MMGYPALRPIRVMLVEDNKGDVLLLQRAFAKLGVKHEIIVETTGEAALQSIRRATAETYPDMVILDLKLPGVSGQEVLNALKADEQLCFIPVFMLTSSCARADLLESYQSHANCYIVKPHDLESLCQIAQRIGDFWCQMALLPNPQNMREPFSHLRAGTM